MAELTRRQRRHHHLRRRARSSAPPRSSPGTPVTAQKGGYKHFLLKEIHEQPQAIIDTMRGRILQEAGDVQLDAEVDRRLPDRRSSAACWSRAAPRGTPAWSASSCIEQLAGLPCEVDYGSEFRYRDPILDPATLLIVVSQSGETADTLAAVEAGRERGAPVLAVCNVVDSSIARRAPRRALHARRPGDQRREHEGVHDPADGALPARASTSAGSAGVIDAERGRQLLSDLVALPAR